VVREFGSPAAMPTGMADAVYAICEGKRLQRWIIDFRMGR
jgi:hypothetical protein